MALRQRWRHRQAGQQQRLGKEYEYDKSKLASETFMALEATEAEWVLQGPLNCTLFKELPMEKYFTHAPIFETTDESEITYEPTGTPNNIADARTTAASRSKTTSQTAIN